MKPRISDALRETIIQLHKEGYSGTDISSQLGNKPSVSAINKLVKKYKETNSVQDLPRKRTEKVSQELKTMIRDTYDEKKNW